MSERVLVLAAMVLSAAAPRPAHAIPAFARRYVVDCQFCHVGYPKLNAAGERFKERGFRMAQEEAFAFKEWARAVPVDLRASATWWKVQDTPDHTTGFLKPIAAGSLGRRFSYWIDEGVSITGGADTFHHTRPDNLWARVDVLPAGRLYARAGRFELDLPFTNVRRPHVFSYQTYFAGAGFEPENLADHHDGLEVGGQVRPDLHWSAAVVGARDTEGERHVEERGAAFEPNLFLRVARRLTRHRVGAFAYLGRHTLEPTPGLAARDTLLRLGADASVWWRRLNLYGVALYGRNSNATVTAQFPGGTHEPLSFGAGFLQADWHVREDLVLTLRGDVVDRATSTFRLRSASVLPGLQFFVRQRLKVGFEYAFTNHEAPDVAAVTLDLAF